MLWDNTKEAKKGEVRWEQGLGTGKGIAVGQGRRSKEPTESHPANVQDYGLVGWAQIDPSERCSSLLSAEQGDPYFRIM